VLTGLRLLDSLHFKPGDRVAIGGGGGKTTIMYRLAAEAADEGRSTVVGGTTRFTPPRDRPLPPLVLVEAGADPTAALRDALDGHRAVTCTTGHGDKGRLLPIDETQAAAIAAMPEVDLLALEADGSRNRPFKAPADGEPVIPPGINVVLHVVGLDVIGRPLEESWVHRPERVAAILGLSPGSPLTPEHVARVLLDARGGRKGVPAGARWIPVLNKAEEERRPAGDRLAELLLAGGAERVLLARAAAQDPVVAVFEAGTATDAQ
jgi:probable selenium-dependent hydroxylase accessory protein YqeC